MSKAPIAPRRRGRPTREESTAIALEKAVVDAREALARLTPKAVKTLETLLDTGTEKVKETTAKYILEQNKEAYGLYVEEDNEESNNITINTGDSVPEDNIRSLIPLTTEIREYKLAEGDD